MVLFTIIINLYKGRKVYSSSAVKILGVRFHNLTVQEALSAIRQTLEKHVIAKVCFLNLDCVRQAQKDTEYRQILNSADIVLSDGVGLRLLLKLSGNKMRENCNGTDLSPKIIEMCAQLGYSVFFLGGKTGVALSAAVNLKARFPGLKVAGAREGYFFDLDEVIRHINDSKADVLFVAMGVPLQEKFITHNRERLNPRLCLGVGAFLDYTSGIIKRAPLWLIRLRLEWLWRICIDPQRMIKRYIIDGMGFMLWAVGAILISKQK